VIPSRTQRVRRTQRSAVFFVPSVFVTTAFVTFSLACGKKGPPLPPLVRLPAAPADFTASRRGATVDLQFTVPATNTDNTRPANVGHVDVYAITSVDPVPAEEVVKRGSRVATVAVKAPRDPDRTIEQDEPPADMEAPEGSGLDQGAMARLNETLTPAVMQPAPAAADRKTEAARSAAALPLLGPRWMPMARQYVAVGVSPRDRKGPYSKPIAVPIVPPPPTPGGLAVYYTETAITVQWTPIAERPSTLAPPADGLLPSTAIGEPAMRVAYNVYDTTQKPAPAKLTASPVGETKYADTRIAWGEERCYTVRAIEILGELTVESDAPPPECRTLKDTFPPAPPAGLLSSPLDGAINLIWDPSPEKDLAGYIVLRGTSPDTLRPITDAPLQVTTYLDKVPSGERFTYAIKAVDKAGNVSPASALVEESAR
jgi:hypothetical protein